jgi:transcriptional regulator with XRE-family HTH domain
MVELVYQMIGLRIRKIRETLGWSQNDLCKKLEDNGLIRTSIANIELGKQRIMLHDVEAIAKAFGMTAKQLLKGIWT